MAPRISASECPNCGAPVDVRQIADASNPSCPFCGTPLPTVDDVAVSSASGTTFGAAQAGGSGSPQFQQFQPFQFQPFQGPSSTGVRVGRSVRRIVLLSFLLPLIIIAAVVVPILLTVLHRTTSISSGGGHTLNSSAGGGGTQGPAANIGVRPGDQLAVGYDLTIAGPHPAVTFTISNAKIVFTADCTSDGNSVTFTALFPKAQFVLAAGNSAYPTGDFKSGRSYQSSIRVPDLCKGASMVVTDDRFSADERNSVPAGVSGHPFDMRWHWKGRGSDGNWSGTASGTL